MEATLEPYINLDLNAARLVHVDWLMRLEKAIDSGQDEAGEALQTKALQSHKDCELGAWLYGIGQSRYRDFDELRRLSVEHKKFHHLIEMGVSSLQLDNRTKAVHLLKEARQTSKDIIYLITYLELEIVERKRKRYLALHPLEAIRSFFSHDITLD